MDLTAQLLIIAVLILVNAFFAAAEIAVVTASNTRIKALADQGDRRARLVDRISRDSTQFLATIQIGITLAGFFTSATAASQLSAPLAQFFQPLLGQTANSFSFILVTLGIAFISLVFGELVPKRLGLRHAEAIALFAVVPIAWLGRVTLPVVKLLSFITNRVLGLLGSPLDQQDTAVNVEEIKALVDAARLGGTVGLQEQRIIYGAVELHHLTARAIMVPRVQISYLKTDTPLEEALKIASETAYTRLPVCNGDLDHIVGILHVKDLIRVPLDPGAGRPTLRELIRPVRFVPEAEPVANLLREMQHNRLHLVIVTDEFGGTAGLITLEDVLEEIVGEIRDEYDAEEEREFHRIDTHSGIFKIRASIATVNNELRIHLPREDAATLAGLFLEELQRSPQPGDHLKIDQVSLTVLEDGQRVQVTQMELPATEEP